MVNLFSKMYSNTLKVLKYIECTKILKMKIYLIQMFLQNLAKKHSIFPHSEDTI